jgi:hypothetical protein
MSANRIRNFSGDKQALQEKFCKAEKECFGVQNTEVSVNFTYLFSK